MICIRITLTILQFRPGQSPRTLILVFLVVLIFRYFFPTYENDALLCSLEDDEDEDEKEEQRNPGEDNK